MISHLLLCALAWAVASALRVPNASVVEESFKDVILVLQGVEVDQMIMLDKAYGNLFREVKFMIWTKPGRDPLSALSISSEVTLADEDKAEGGNWPFLGNPRPAKDYRDDAKGGDADNKRKASTTPPLPFWLTPPPVEGKGEHLKEAMYARENAEIFEPQVLRCGSPNRYVSKCLAPYLQELLDNGAVRARGIKGVLVSHVDFWFRPKEVLKLGRLDRIWQLQGGLEMVAPHVASKGPNCFSNWRALQNDKTFSWGENGKSISWEAAIDALSLYKGNQSLGKTTVCNGWSDLYYLPAGILDEFVAMAPAFHKTYHGVALPTLLHMLQPLQGRHMLVCEGTCCAKTPMLARNVGWGDCGHKMDLKQHEVRIAWKEMMSAYQPKGMRITR